MINPLIHGAGLIIQRERFNEMSTLATLVVKLVGDVGDFTNKMNIVPKNVQKVAHDIGKAFNMVTPIFNDVKAIVEATAGEFVRYAGQVRTVSNAIGASAEESSKLIQAADDVQLSQESLTTALLGAIKKGYKPTVENIGVLADKYNAIQDPIAKTKFLMDTFGKSGADMARLMQLGAAGIKAAGDEAERFGLVLSDKDLQAARDLEIQIDNLNDRVEGLKIKVGRALVPVLTKAAEGLGYIADAILPVSGREAELRQAIIRAALAFGTESQIVKSLSGELILYLQTQKRLAEYIKTVGADALWGISGALDETTRAQQRAIEASRPAIITEAQLAAARRVGRDALWGVSGALDETTRAQQRFNDTSPASIAAQQAIQQAAANSAISFQDEAMALLGLGRADIVKASLDALKESLNSGAITQARYTAGAQTIELQYGLVTKASLAAATAQQTVNDLYNRGLIGPEQLAAALSKIPGASRDGIVTLTELGLKALEAQKQVAAVGSNIKPLPPIKNPFAHLKDPLEEADLKMQRIDQTTLPSLVTATATAVPKLVRAWDDWRLSIDGPAGVRPAFEQLTTITLPNLESAVVTATQIAATHIDNVTLSLNNIPTNIDVNINVHYTVVDPLPMVPHATGGPVLAGQPYWVGERGPEPFISASNGYMLSHADAMSAVRDGGGQGGSGLSMVFEQGAIIVNGAGDPDRVAKAVLDEAGRRADARMRSR